MYDFDKILYIDKYEYENLDRNTRIKFVLKRFKDSLFSSNQPKNKCNNFVFFKSLIRDDYNYLFNKVTSACTQASYLKIDKPYIVNNKINKKYLFVLFQNLNLFFCFSAGSLKQRIFLYTRLCFYKMIAEVICNYKLNRIIVFADMQPVDNLICQMAKTKKISTTTLQHGLYVDYEKQFNVNIVNYQNHVADYFLAWGEDTKKLIKKYHPNSKVIIVGKPIDEIKYREIKNYFTVVFDQNIFHEYNKKILDISYKIAQKFNLKINLRLHPNNKLNLYNIRQGTVLIDEDLYCSQFVIGHTTSILYELMRQGIPSYKYRSDIPSNLLDEEFKFTYISELENKINKHQNNNFDFAEYAKRYIKYIGEESLGKYKEFFEGLENGKY
jgi:hypothetical protein